MSKLTNAEKDKLDNTCGNLRVTKLGTHVKSLEDFVNEGILKTRANDVSSAINELWDMITNKDCESITIPPPGFFTLFGDDQTGKLYVYYNNADYPPQFHHVETPGELEGTLYLYIADPVGENHYELEVGHYIAVRHLDNYYTKAQINSMFTVTVEKQTTAESGSFATYVVKQGGNQVGCKINIPKDYLVKSCSVKTCTTANVPVQGYNVGDKYIDWVINTRDSSATNEHLYLLVSEIAEPYKADNSTMTLSSGNVFSVKDGGITLVKLAPAVQNLIDGKAESDHDHGNITKDGKVGTAANVPLITGTGGVVQAGAFGSGTNNFARGNHGHSDLASIAYVDQQIVNIEGDIEVDFDSKADRIHTHMLDDIKVTSALSANSDLNDLTDVGIYTCGATNSGTLANRPPYFGNYALLIENKYYSSTTVVQFVYALMSESPLAWYRYHGSSGWSQWTYMGGCSATVPANTDLNDLTDLTMYACNTANSATLGHKPFTGNRACIIQNKVYNNHNYFIQFVYMVMADNSLNEIYYRIHYNGTWLDWNKVIRNSDLTTKADVNHSHFLDDITITGELSANDDLNNYTNVGWYICSKTNGGTLANKPFTGTYGGLIENKLGSSGGAIIQTFYKVTTQASTYYDVYFREYTSNGWGDWVRIYTDKDIAKINGANLNLNNSSNISIEDAISGKAESDHDHGNITKDGKVGTAANKPLITGTNGVVQAGSFGTAANTFCQGNDSRLTDNRTPINNQIPANSDLNNFITQGFYYCQGDVDIVPTVTNQPLTTNQKSFVMIVQRMSPTRIVQILTYYHTNVTYTRTYVNSAWNSWTALIKEGDSRLSNARTPTSHAVNANTYGLGTTGVYGHVKTVNGLTQASHSDGLALSAYQGKVLNDSKANKTDVVNLAFYISNSINSGTISGPEIISISKGGYLYIGCTDANGNIKEGNVLIHFNNGANIYNRTLSNGMASLQLNNTGTFNIIIFYHENGHFKASMFGRVTVT